MDNETIIYSLTVEDVQNVAFQELNRELSKKEIEKLEDKIAEKIPWYEAISDALYQGKISRRR